MKIQAVRMWMVLALVSGVCAVQPAGAQSIFGTVANGSLWEDLLPPPPGDGDGWGQLVLALWSGSPESGGTLLALGVITNGVLPLDFGPYPFAVGGGLVDGGYTLLAWIDANTNLQYDIGEPRSLLQGVTIANSNSVGGVQLRISDDTDNDRLPDWWEVHWFQYTPNPMEQGGTQDSDGDGLSNAQEAQIALAGIGMELINPAHWDSDGDGMDDKWEYDHYDKEHGFGLNPTVYSKTQDFDGDGLSDWQEYCGVDGRPLMILDRYVDGVWKGRVNAYSPDDLNPLDVDTDYDLLVDSFEAAWYDPANGIDPRAGVMTFIPTNAATVDTTLARADSDRDGLSNYREQCLLPEFREGGVNNLWVWQDRVPFPQVVYYTDDGRAIRIVLMSVIGAPLNLGLNPAQPFVTSFNRAQLRAHAWTDPTEDTGYLYTDEDIPPGHDTDDDWLPDGWEVQFGLDPRDDGLSGFNWDNGPFGDPDGDGLMNWEEYLGQDGERFTTDPFINGTGDETNPNRAFHRPDSTYDWRWFPVRLPFDFMTDPRPGTGISRRETLGAALPTQPLTNGLNVYSGTNGCDHGRDSDDDGLPDTEEIHPSSPGRLPSSPVHSCDPFIPRSVLILSSNGIPIPDPEPAAASGTRPAGMREDLQRRDWTIECQVRLLATNLTGDLLRFESRYGPQSRTIYRLALSNDHPVLISQSSDGAVYTLTANRLPTNRWIHLAGVWDHANNTLGLYLQGVLFIGKAVYGECASSLMHPATNQLVLAASADGSFVGNLLLDEVRIWGVARTPEQIAEYANRLLPPANGDDVWLDWDCPQYYGHSDFVLVNGGGLFAGEPGVPLAGVYSKGTNYWLDDGDGQYMAARDILLRSDGGLREGDVGGRVDNARWNDRDGSGSFTVHSLLAYYRFDDGGTTAEDFARRAKNTLTGATAEEYLFGDHGYALPTNAFAWVTNDVAFGYGVDQRGADDSDGDGLPDAWELINHLDPWDDGAGQESAPGAKDGPFGPRGDPDHDGLNNLYEYWSGTNPRQDDSDGNGVLDAEEDRDGDGVVNITEQELGSRPDLVDTDDDGLPDNLEQANGTSPADAADPAVSRAVRLGGSAVDYVEVPLNVKQRLTDWTLEALVRPANTNAGGVIVRRVVEQLAAGGEALNYAMGLETNGTGGLRLYAGYVRTDGRTYLVRGPTVPVGTDVWTHVAASYDSLRATLTLYTNGTPAAVTNTFYLAPPLNGRGGEVFLRIGEGFAGDVDEIRLWNRVRTTAEIAANTNRTLASTDTNGLVHYFTFDDSEADTNLFPLSEYHQPQGVQDFTYPQDWNAQWRHAAGLHGTIAFISPGAIVPPPSLRVKIEPAAARDAGARWSLDGGAWQVSGDALYGLTPGSHVLLFKTIAGWTAPPMETVVLTNGVATTITRQYLPTAGICVFLEPTNAVAAGAQWRVDGGDWQMSGAVVSNLPAGTHSLEFKVTDGWIEPPVENVTLLPGEGLVLTRLYQPAMGSICAVIVPQAAIDAGAAWRLDNEAAWRSSGAVVTNLALSGHTVEFRSLEPLWRTPPRLTVTLTNQALVTVTGQYTQVTGLYVELRPPEAVADGARWNLNGGGYTNQSGTLMELPAGTYRVGFSPVTGWLAPGEVQTVVVSQAVTTVAVRYYRAVVYGGEVGSAPGQFNKPRAVALDAYHRLYVSDSFNDRIQVFDPITESWTVWGQFGTNAGPYFNKPYGLTLDAAGNLYVADAANNRIQKRLAQTGAWTNWGGFGTNVGRFIGPTDVAVDALTNVYVADLYNSRVQRLGTNGVWSVFIDSGTVTGRVRDPLGLLWDGAGRLYVSDDGTATNGACRVQQFNLTGGGVEVLGDRLETHGGLRRPGGMTCDGTNLYVADIDNSRIRILNLTNGTWQTLIDSNALNQAEDVVWDPRGLLYIADTENNRIVRVVLDSSSAAISGAPAVVFSLSTPGTNAGFTISWYGQDPWLYAVLSATNLLEHPAWTVLPGATNIPGRNAVTNYTDTAVPGVPNRFYRVLGY